jgi:8-oxo-dGTP diphosphatase
MPVRLYFLGFQSIKFSQGGTVSYIDKLAWIHIKDKQILVTLSKGKDKYYIPGGKRENGESDHEALNREILEELSVRLLQDKIAFVEKFEAQAHDKPEGVMVRMTCYSGDYEGQLQASSEIEEIHWLKHSDSYKCSKVDAIIMDWLKKADLID